VSRTEWTPELTLPVGVDRDHIQGPADAAVTLLEYGDYECPFCGAAYPIVKEVQSRMGNRLRFVFRNFPITTSHPHAERAAEAAEAASSQGKFWEMHDLLYEHQQDLADSDMVRYALRLGLEVYRFESDLSGEVFARRVSDDFRGGVRSGVNGTPTFFIKGARYDGAHDYDSLRAALEEAASQRAV